MSKRAALIRLPSLAIVSALFLLGVACAQNPTTTAAAKNPFSNFRTEKPGTMHKITVGDLPAPYATKSASNGPDLVPRPKDVWPQAPPGFKVELFTDDVKNPRKLLTAPNGDLFVAESSEGRIKIFRGIGRTENRSSRPSSQQRSRSPTASRSTRRARIRNTFTSGTTMRCCASRITTAT